MASTTGDHILTYPNEGVKNWYSTFQAFAQAITNHLDNLQDVQIDKIEDSNDNELLAFTAVGSAVNYLNISNAATGNGPTLAALGDDTNIDFNIAPKGTGKLILDGLNWPTADGSANQVLITDGSANLSFATRLGNVVEDTTPQLGGGLDVNGQEITGAIDLHSTGDVILELGDAAGSNKVSIRDSGANEVASINSDGDITATDITANSLTVTTAIDGTSVDINGTTALTTPADADEILVYDADAAANKKITRANFKNGLQGGAWVPLSNQTISTATTNIDISLTSGYNKYYLVGHAIETNTNDVDFYMRFQTAGGSFRAGASDYAWTCHGASTAGALSASDGSDSEIVLNDEGASGLGSAAGKQVAFKIAINAPRDSGVQTMVDIEIAFIAASGAPTALRGCGILANAEDNDEVRLLLSSGAIDSGNIILYGVKEST